MKREKRTRTAKKLVILGASLFLVFLLLFWTIAKNPRSVKATDKTRNNWGLTSKEDPDFVKIVYWSNAASAAEKRERDWLEQLDPQRVICKQLKCMFSSNRSLALHSDALLIHASKTEYYPTSRPTGQKWVFYEGSTPPVKMGEYPTTFYHHKDHFNFMSTYSQHQSQLSASMLPWATCKQTKTAVETPIGNYSAGKSHQVAWLATRCETGSAREEYISELNKHIAVDTLGNCNSKHCPRGKEDCIHNLLDEKYKFLLVFEDEICLDYVTTPLAMAYTVNVVPVVMGGANYATLLPPGSYINAKDFNSPEHLAEYLKKISSESARFNDVVAARFRSVCVRNDPYLCKLCNHLHSTKKSTKRLLNVEQYWNYESLCSDSEEFYSF